MIKNYEYQSDFARKYYGAGRAEGLREAAVALARARVRDLAAPQEAAIRAVREETELTQLIADLGSAADADEARGILEKLGKPAG